MATKTVISNNMAQTTRGISIIIDQEPRRELDQQQSLVVGCKGQQQQQLQQQMGTSIITIEQKTVPTTTTTIQTTTTTTNIATMPDKMRSTATVVGSAMQQMSPKQPATPQTTLVDIYRKRSNHVAADNDVKAVGDDDVADDERTDEDAFQRSRETGYTAAATFPQQLLLLKVASERGKLTNKAGKSHKTHNSNNNSVHGVHDDGDSDGDVDELIDDVSLTVHEHQQQLTNGTIRVNDGDNYEAHYGIGGQQKTIIQCNGEPKNEATTKETAPKTTATAAAMAAAAREESRGWGKESSSNGVSLAIGTVFDDVGANAGSARWCDVDAAKLDEDNMNGNNDNCDGNDDAHDDDDDVDGQQQRSLESVYAARRSASLQTKADCASGALTESVARRDRSAPADSHVVKIQIKPCASVAIETEKRPDTTTTTKTTHHSDTTVEKQVTVVKLNEVLANESVVPKIDLRLTLDKMVIQKPMGIAQNGSRDSGYTGTGANSVGSGGGGGISSGGTTVTELNVSNPSYLYYMMSSGQFSPCDTLDSGTGSDLESNGQQNGSAAMPKTIGNTANGSGGAPKLEMHLKTTKIRVNGSAKSDSEHQRAGSLTDSEESESSSLSCDSLHSSEFMRQSSVSPTGPKAALPPPGKGLGSFLPDSLLRDIRDRKFPTNDFDTKYGSECADLSAISHGNASSFVETAAHAKTIPEPHATSGGANGNKRASMPSKTFVLNANDGTFMDTKLNSMPRKYEADKYYNFHVNEHENFRSFGNGDYGGQSSDAVASLSEYGGKSMQEDAFAGYKDIRCGSATSTIRSSKGTVRGVKNRVRNGIATFLQLQQPNGKNFKEKDGGKVVLYTTSMGIIRDTYAKCSNMKQILRTLLVKFEERDIFMSVEYQQEIKERMQSPVIKVPQLFVEGQHIGDADTVERLNESGELRQLLKPYKSIAATYICQTCGGYRLLPCPSCNGSKKSVHRNHFTAEFVALKCMNCDEVGLVKCHNC